MGKRLPTDAEWEKAVRGTDGRRYHWGDTFDPKRAHVGRPHQGNTCSPSRLARVGSHPEEASPYGCLDMAGNAGEWVADDYRSDPPRHVIRGGAFGYPERFLRTYALAIEEAGVT